MGSGCTNNNQFGTCFETISSNCIKWAGDATPQLNICTGDNITEDIQSIITSLLTLLNGSGITLSTVNTDCPLVASELGNSTSNLPNLLQAVINALCTVNNNLTTLTTQVNTPVSYNVVCLTPTANTTQAVLQAAINALCSLQTQVTALTAEVVDNSLSSTINTYVGNYLANAINSCGNSGINKTGTGATTEITFTGLMPIGSIIFYDDILTVFDSNGAGISGTGWCGWQICNGNNGTKDMRGFVPGGATNLPGVNAVANLNNIVDPIAQADATLSSNVQSIAGEAKHQLGVPEIPAIAPIITVVDPGHIHVVQMNTSSQSGNNTPCFVPNSVSGAPAAVPINTSKSYTNITATTPSFGGNQKHENRQPTYYGVFVKKVS